MSPPQSSAGHNITERVLIIVYSAGIDPWLSIERQEQEPILAELRKHFVDTLWFQGAPEISARYRYRFLNWLILQQLGLTYSEIPWLRKFVKSGWNRFEWNALGSRYLKHMVRKRWTRPTSDTSNHRIFQDLPIQLPLSGIRTLDSLRYSIENYEFDYLLRINSTCLPVPSQIAELVAKLPSERVYGGKTLQFAGTRFVSGAAIIFSRDVVRGIVDNAERYCYNVYEDVGIGRLIQSKNLADIVEIKRLDITALEHVPVVVSPGWPAAYAVRCKAENPETTRSEPVVELMRAVRKHL